jgi:ferrochelatase
LKTAIVFTNIGTPKSPAVKDVANYLNQFLMDPGVISLPFLLRWILVKLIIVPRRAPISAGNYQRIWTKEGSPLMVYSKNFLSKVQKQLPNKAIFKIAMNFGEPSIDSVLSELKDLKIEKMILIPMFPQFAKATTQSTIDLVNAALGKLGNPFKMQIFGDFFDQDFYLDPICQMMKEYDLQSYDKILFSYHGLPISQVKENPSCQLTQVCCQGSNRCYRSHCYKTTQKLVQKLGISSDKAVMTFQSRLGRKEWLQPYTTDVINELPKQGHKKILVVSPAFVADCLETLEEINIGLKEDFLKAGGTRFELVPCLNDFDPWVSGFCNNIIRLID